MSTLSAAVASFVQMPGRFSGQQWQMGKLGNLKLEMHKEKQQQISEKRVS